jgi:hypothetical protein
MLVCVWQVDSGIKLQTRIAIYNEGGRLAQAFFGIPEFHDEGRLIAGHDAEGRYFGPMAEIYASPFLYAFTRPAQIWEQGRPGTLAAIVVVTPTAEETIPTTYSNLKLQAGVNCIWLNVTSLASPPKYEAYVSHKVPCDRTEVEGPLPVTAIRYTAFTKHGDYPPVARFDLDNTLDQPLLGFKCLAAFCEVGVTSDKTRGSWVPKDNIGGSERRVRTIQGWHDEQLLAYRDKKSVWRATARASITPDPSAADYDLSNFQNAGETGLHVATIWIHDQLSPDNVYYKWGLRKGANQMALRVKGSAWEALITPPGAKTPLVWTNTTRMPHYDAAVPSIARFRWTIIDDGVWVPCGNACCRSDGGAGS